MKCQHTAVAGGEHSICRRGQFACEVRAQLTRRVVSRREVEVAVVTRGQELN